MRLEALRDRGFLTRGSARILLVNGGGKAVALVVAGVLAYLLGAEGFGVYSVAISWVTVISMFSALGFPMLLLRELSTSVAREDWERIRGVLRFSGRWVMVASLGFCAIGAALAWISFPSGDDRLLRSAIFIGLVLVPIRAFAKLRHGSLQGLRSVVKAQLPEQVIRPAAMLLLLAIWVLAVGGSTGPRLALILQIGAGLVSVLLSTWWLWGALPRQVWTVDKVEFGEGWIASATHMLLYSSITVFLAQSGILAMAFLAEQAEVGIFALSVRLSEGLLIFLAAVSAPLMPIVAKLNADGRVNEMQRYLRLGVFLSLGAALPIGIGMLLASDLILSWFGRDFTGGEFVFRLLIVSQLLNTAFGPVGLLLNMSGHERDAAIGISFAAVLNVLLCLSLVPTWGAEGAAWAMLLSTLTWNIWLTVLAWRRVGVVPGILSVAVRTR